MIPMGTISEQAAILRRRWETDPRWAGIGRTYSAEDVLRLRGPVAEEHTLARLGATRLWDLLHGQDEIRTLGLISGSQAARLAKAGLQAVAAGPERGAEGPAAEQFAPVVADAEAGSGGALNAFELTTAMIEAGSAGVCLEDRLSPEEKDGQLSGKVLIPTGEHIRALTAARLAADVLGVPTLVMARTAALTATLLTSDADERDHEFLTGERTAEGFCRVRPGLYACATRALAFAPYADVLWLEAQAPDLPEARAFAQIIHSQYPGKRLAYSCSPSRDWSEHADDARFQRELATMGYRLQFTTPASVPVPDAEFADGPSGYGPARGQCEDRTRYSDLVTRVLAPEAAAWAAALEPAHFVGHDQVDHHGRLVPAD